MTDIQPKVIHQIFESFHSNQLLFEKVSFRCLDVKRINDSTEMISHMKTAQSIKIELADDVLPDEIFDELKWLCYYQFHSDISVKNNKLFHKYNVCSQSIQIKKDILKNFIYIQRDSKEYIYIINGSITEGIFLNQNLETNEINPHLQKDIQSGILLLSQFDEELISSSILKTITHGTIKHPKVITMDAIQQNQASIYYTNEMSLMKNDYLIIGHTMYQLLKLNNRIILLNVYNQTSQESFYKQSIQNNNGKFIYHQNQFVQVQEEKKQVHIHEYKESFDDYELGLISTDFNSLLSSYIEYEVIDFIIHLYPPMIKKESDFKLSPKYSQLESFLEKYKTSISSEPDENDQKVLKSHTYRTFDNMFLKSSKSKDHMRLLEELKKLVIKYPEKSYIDVQFRDLFVSDMQDYIHHTNQVNFGTFNQEFILSMYTINSNSDHLSSLSRVIQGFEITQELSVYKSKLLKLNKRVLDHYDSMTRVIELIHSLNLPDIGLLYEYQGKTLLGIRHEHEIIKAKEMAKKYGARLCVIEEASS